MRHPIVLERFPLTVFEIKKEHTLPSNQHGFKSASWLEPGTSFIAGI